MIGYSTDWYVKNMLNLTYVVKFILFGRYAGICFSLLDRYRQMNDLGNAT
jgi:hypothetical protein